MREAVGRRPFLIEGPERVRLVLDPRTARALRLAVPQSLVLRADEVIE